MFSVYLGVETRAPEGNGKGDRGLEDGARRYLGLAPREGQLLVKK